MLRVPLLSAPRRIAISGLVLAAGLAGAAVAAPAMAASAASAGLSAVSCTSQTFCLAVGSVTSSQGQTSSLAQTWNGRAWRAISAPAIAGGLGDVSCSSRSFCLAVSGGGAEAATWNGSAWTIADPPATPHFFFTHVSCTSSTFCMTVGDFFGPSAVWNGKTWTELAVPKPSGSTTFNLADVSCTRPSYCMAAGVYATDPHGELLQTVAETWNGHRWSVISSPQHNQESTFNAITCMLRQGCVAVGNYGSQPDVGYNIAARYSGGAWKATWIPGGYGYGAGLDNGVSGPTDVSCASPANCMTVGSYLNGTEHSLAVVWNGRTWRLSRLNWQAGGVADASCTSRVNCVAVGQSHSRAAIRHWNGTAWTAMTAAATR